MNSGEDMDSYADGSLLVELLGNDPKVKIIAALLAEGSYEVHKSQLAEMAGLSRQTMHNGHLDDLVDWGIVEKGRKIGNYQLYRLNVDSPVVAELDLLQEELLFKTAEESRENEDILASLENKLYAEAYSEDDLEDEDTMMNRAEMQEWD